MFCDAHDLMMSKSLLPALVLLAVGTSFAAVQLNSDMKVFGHAINKNGHFPAKGTEVTTFEHNCTTAPCAITQIVRACAARPRRQRWRAPLTPSHIPQPQHCPTAGPVGWQDARLRIYIDGEKTATIDITLLELANVGVYNGQDGDAAPWGAHAKPAISSSFEGTS